MKELVSSLTKGQRIKVEVVELQSHGEILVAYRGELFRVKNNSIRQFKIGEKVLLTCTNSDPVELSLFLDQKSFIRVI